MLLHILTLSQSQDCIERMEKALVCLYETKSEPRTAIKKIVTPEEFEALPQSISSSVLLNALKEAISFLKQLPVLTIQVPFSPSLYTLYRTSSKCESMLGQRVLLDIQTTPQPQPILIGWKGKTSLFSFL